MLFLKDHKVLPWFTWDFWIGICLFLTYSQVIFYKTSFPKNSKNQKCPNLFKLLFHFLNKIPKNRKDTAKPFKITYHFLRGGAGETKFYNTEHVPNSIQVTVPISFRKIRKIFYFLYSVSFSGWKFMIYKYNNISKNP